MTTIQGQQIKLSKDKKEAKKAFHSYMSRGEGPASGDARPSFRKIADLFLQHQHTTKKANTFRMHKYFVQSFCDHVGQRKVADVRVHMVSAWLAANPDWNQSTQTGARSALQACLNWAVNEDLVAVNPVGKMRRGGYRKRERVLTIQERKQIRATAHADFSVFLFALEQTGARPFSELARLEAALINWKEGTATIKDHKTSGKGKDRILYFTKQLQQVLKQQADKYPTGPLFRTQRGNPVTERLKLGHL